MICFLLSLSLQPRIEEMITLNFNLPLVIARPLQNHKFPSYHNETVALVYSVTWSEVAQVYAGKTDFSLNVRFANRGYIE